MVVKLHSFHKICILTRAEKNYINKLTKCDCFSILPPYEKILQIKVKLQSKNYGISKVNLNLLLERGGLRYQFNNRNKLIESCYLPNKFSSEYEIHGSHEINFAIK